LGLQLGSKEKPTLGGARAQVRQELLWRISAEAVKWLWKVADQGSAHSEARARGNQSVPQALKTWLQSQLSDRRDRPIAAK